MIRQLFFLKGPRYRQSVESLRHGHSSFKSSLRFFPGAQKPACWDESVPLHALNAPPSPALHLQTNPAFEVPMHTCDPCPYAAPCAPSNKAAYPRFPKHSNWLSGNQCVKIHAVKNCHIVVIYRSITLRPFPRRQSSSGFGCGVSRRGGPSCPDEPDQWRCVE
jgi:hypothetical protein